MKKQSDLRKKWFVGRKTSAGIYCFWCVFSIGHITYLYSGMGAFPI